MFSFSRQAWSCERAGGCRASKGEGEMPVPLDEYPLHQVPLSMAYVATSDRNAYDRCYVNAHDRTGDLFVVSGLGVYPNLGVRDAFITVMRSGRQSTLQLSDAMGDEGLSLS